MTRLYLVRHAQTRWNRENRIQGHSDLPLSLLGQQQAQRLGVFFSSFQLQTIVTSPLQRSRETAQAIAAGNGHGAGPVRSRYLSHGAGPVIEEELAEMHLGAWEGLTPEEVDARFHGAYQQWRQAPSSIRIPDAEPLASFRARVRRAWGKVLGRVGEGESVLVSHGGVIAALLADLLHADYDALLRRLRLDNAGITALECGNGRPPHVLWVNATTHLDALSQAADETWF